MTDKLSAVVASVTRRYAELILEDGSVVLSKKATSSLNLTVGDRVSVLDQRGEFLVYSSSERENALKRSFGSKTKLLVSNIDVALLVVQPLPLTNLIFVDRVLCLAKLQNIPVVIVINKCDLKKRLQDTIAILAYYENLSCSIILTSAITDYGITELVDFLNTRSRNKLFVAAMFGMSGVGKTSLVNALIPGVNARIGEVAQKGMGKQTTSQSRMYSRSSEDGVICIVDLPGIQNFGLEHLSEADIIRGFGDIYHLSKSCRFTNCRHEGDEGCAVEEAVKQGNLPLSRLDGMRNVMKGAKKTY